MCSSSDERENESIHPSINPSIITHTFQGWNLQNIILPSFDWLGASSASWEKETFVPTCSEDCMIYIIPSLYIKSEFMPIVIYYSHTHTHMHMYHPASILPRQYPDLEKTYQNHIDTFFMLSPAIAMINVSKPPSLTHIDTTVCCDNNVARSLFLVMSQEELLQNWKLDTCL